MTVHSSSSRDALTSIPANIPSASPKPGFLNLSKQDLIRLSPLAVLTFFLLTTWLLWLEASNNKQQAEHAYFDFRTREAVTLIEQRIQAYSQVLQGVKGLYQASNKVERNEFKDYVEALNLAKKYPGIQGVGFSEVVPFLEKTKHIERIRQQGFANYTITPTGPREIYTAIIYIEPFTGRNVRAFGFDMYSESVRRVAMDYARDTGEISMSGKVRLVQETGLHDQAGFLMYAPIYKNGLPHATLAQRRANFLGWAYLPFRMNDLMYGIYGEHANDLGIQLFDGKTLTNQTLMYDSAALNSNRASASQMALLQSNSEIEIAHHIWTLNIIALPSLYKRINKLDPRLIAIIGITFSFLLTWLSWLLVNGRARAITAAKIMNLSLIESESRFRLMANSAPVLIWIADIHKHCFWFNKVWLDYVGYEQVDDIRASWAWCVHPDDYVRCDAIYSEAFDHRESFTMEYRMLRHDGVYRWLLDHGVARYSDAGIFEGYIGSCTDVTEVHEAQASLQLSYDLLNKLSQQIPGMIYQFKMLADGTSFFPYVSAGIETIYELTPEQVSEDASMMFSLIHAEDHARVVSSINQSMQTLQPWQMEYRVNLPKKGLRWLFGQAKPEKLDDESTLWHGFIMDVTDDKDRKLNETNLKLAASVFTNAHESIFITDANCNIIKVNETFTLMTGYTSEEVIGQNPRILSSGKHAPEFFSAMWKDINETGFWAGELWNKRKNGELFVGLMTISAVCDAKGIVQNYVALTNDIMYIKQHQQVLERMAHYDVLTNLPNRAFLANALAQSIQTLPHDQSLAVVFVDLDWFKNINDVWGHDMGDRLLVVITQRMQAALREHDILARIGGDEFVVVLNNLVHADDYKPVIERLLHAVSSSVKLGEAVLQVSASVGLTLYSLARYSQVDNTQTSVDPDQLIRHADLAMYQAKLAGKNRYHVFDMQNDMVLQME